jgi:hypothetical protein
VPDQEDRFWSLYVHIRSQGVECIGDFKIREFAEETYARITGAPTSLPCAKVSRPAFDGLDELEDTPREIRT